MTYDKELAFAKNLAHEAGEIMRRYFKAEEIGTEWKEDSTPVTLADTEVNSLVIKKVKQNFPGYGVLGEEESHQAGGRYLWVVDPIDGTVPFSLGIPTGVFSLALVDSQDGQSVLGVVYEPMLDHLYWSVKGQGAFLNDRAVKVSQQTEIMHNNIYVSGGFKKGPRPYHTGNMVELIRDKGGRAIIMTGAVYFTCKVGSGELIGSYMGNAYAWDMAAVSLIVEEAGGIATDKDGNSARYDEPKLNGGILAANPNVHKQMIELVKQARP